MGGIGSGRPPRNDYGRIVAAYRSGLTLREVAEYFGLTFQRIHQIIRKHAPKLMREPYVVPQRRRRQCRTEV